MKKLLFLLCVITSSTGLNSCNDYLSPTPHDRYSNKVAWESYDNAKLYLNGFYKNLRAYGMLGDAQFGGLHTGGLTSILKYGSSVPGQGNANLYATDPNKITPDQDALSIWGGAYEKIRRINEFLQGLRKYGNFSEDQTAKLAGQARFIRAYIYFDLVIRHGSVILLDQPATKRSHKRSPESKCWNFIAKDLDYGINNLPEKWPNSKSTRITKGAALAMKSRVMLYAKKWDKTISAAEKVMDLGLYALADKYKNAFKSCKEGNKESILEFDYFRPDLVHDWDFKFSPGGDNPGHGGVATPTQNFVEQYETKNGNKIDWSPWHNGTTKAPPYKKLEPRFQATVLYNQEDWKDRKIESYVGGSDGFLDYGSQPYPRGKTTTGYYLKKYVDEQHIKLNKNKSDQPIIEIRYVEVLLNYAEACAMESEEDKANKAIRKVRARVGLPYSNLSGKALLKEIRYERKIELAYEGQRYWDLRRWRLADKKLNNYRVTGMKIQKKGDGFVYKVVNADNQERKFSERLYHLPIPSSEITNNPAIKQISPW